MPPGWDSERFTSVFASFQGRIGSSARIRTENQMPTPEDLDPLDPELKPIQAPAVSDHLVPIRTEKRDSLGAVVRS